LGIKVISRTVGAQSISGNVDRVTGAVPLPKGGKLLSAQGEVHLVGEESQDTGLFAAWGISGQLIPVVDPTTAIQYGALWDNAVVKAADPTVSATTNLLDFDWDTAETAVEIEPGEMDIDALLGVTQGQKEFIAPSLNWVSWAKNKQGGFQAGTPDNWLPSDYKTFRTKRSLTADVPSALMIAVSSPVLDERQAQADHVTPATEAEWYMMANMRDTLKDFGKANAGLMEASADKPYTDASTLVGKLVAPDMLDESSTSFNSMAWTVLVVVTWLLEFPDNSIPNVIDGR
jgi:hypothetical protein